MLALNESPSRSASVIACILTQKETATRVICAKDSERLTLVGNEEVLRTSSMIKIGRLSTSPPLGRGARGTAGQPEVSRAGALRIDLNQPPRSRRLQCMRAANQVSQMPMTLVLFQMGSSHLLGIWHRNPCGDRLPHLSELMGGSLLLAGACQKRIRAMSNYDQNTASPGLSATGEITIDVGLRAFMLRVYNYMAAGVALTGFAAFLTYQFTGPELLQSPLMWVFVLAPLGLVFFISARINTMSVEAARGWFFLYAALVGISLSTIFHIYTQSSITRVFFISAAAFGALSIWGYTTQRNLSGFGTFLFMGLIGIIIASLVNLFLRSSGLDWMLSIIGVGVFAGLTAYDTQRIKGMYDRGDDATSAGRKAVMGALSLYLNFINLFMMMLRLMGGRR
jgi:uncharacterized protein